MKKTISVNLNGISFQIDDDAYNHLEAYLNEISEHYHKNEEKEIIQDIEARLAEIFQDTQVKAHKEVIDLQDVKMAIEQLGHPEQFEAEENNTSSAEEGTSDNKSNTTADNENTNTPKGKKKLYRNPENQVISGVSSGLAAFLGCTPLLIRLLWIVLFFMGYGFTLLAYLIMWIIIPEANTPSKRLEMQGIEVNIETLKKQKEKEDANGVKRSSGTVGKILLIILCLFICFPFLIGIFALIVALIAAIFGLGGLGLAGFFGSMDWAGAEFTQFLNALSMGATPSVGLMIGAILCLLCPLIALIVLIVHLVQSKKNEDTHPKRKKITYITLLVLWIVGIILVHTQRYTLWDNESYKQQIYELTDSITKDAMQQAQDAILFSDSITEDALEQAEEQIEEGWDQAEEQIEKSFN